MHVANWGPRSGFAADPATNTGGRGADNKARRHWNKHYDDVKMFWRDPSIPTVAPDIAVIPRMKEPDPERDSFHEREEGTRPCFVLEVISKATADFDRDDKPKIYCRVKVQECNLDRLKSPWELVARRLNSKTGKYRSVALVNQNVPAPAAGRRRRRCQRSTRR